MGELEPAEANLRTSLRVLRRRWAWILVVTVMCIAIAVAYISTQKKQYSATAQLLVQPASGGSPFTGTQQTISPTNVLDELQLVMSAPVKAQVSKRLGFSPNVSASEVGQTDVIGVTATAALPARASLVANTYARAFVNYESTSAMNALTAAEAQYQSQIKSINAQIQSLQSQPNQQSTVSALANQETALKEELAQLQVAGSQTLGGIQLVSPASTPSSPSSPKPLRDGGIALAVGLLLGIGAAFAAESFDDKIYTRLQAEQFSGGLPVLAMIPKISTWRSKSQAMLITELDPSSRAAEAYRYLPHFPAVH